MVPPPTPPRPPSLAHFAIFTTLKHDPAGPSGSTIPAITSTTSDEHAEALSPRPTVAASETHREVPEEPGSLQDRSAEVGDPKDRSAVIDEGTGSARRQAVDEEVRDKDLEDDLREASQILFYLSRESGTVKRDTMLRQIGLVKGLMGFTE